MTLVDGWSPPATAVPRVAVSIQMKTGTVLDVLAAVARAHGALMWSVPDGTRRPGGAGFSLGFKTFDGGGAGLTAPIHP